MPLNPRQVCLRTNTDPWGRHGPYLLSCISFLWWRARSRFAPWHQIDATESSETIRFPTDMRLHHPCSPPRLPSPLYLMSNGYVGMPINPFFSCRAGWGPFSYLSRFFFHGHHPAQAGAERKSGVERLRRVRSVGSSSRMVKTQNMCSIKEII